MPKAPLVCLLMLLIWGCSSEQESVQDGPDQASPSPEYAADSLMYHQAAQKLVGEFSRRLKGELVSALAEGDAVRAITVCQTIAPEIAAAHSTGGWSIKRVSALFRNPDNRADTAEMAILRQFADTSLPAFVEGWTEADSSVTFAFYKPIRTMPMCLKCHGDLQTLAPGVYETLKKQYPLDRATGYKSNELRGMFVVTADWPEGREQARHIVTDSLAPDSL